MIFFNCITTNIKEEIKNEKIIVTRWFAIVDWVR